MDKKALFIMVSTVLSTGVVAGTQCVEAKVADTHYNGAIIRQLPRDNTNEYLEIQNKFNEDANSFERQLSLIEYYEKQYNYAESDYLYNELIGMIKDLDEPQQAAEIEKCREIIRKKILINPNTARYNYRLYLWEKNFGSYEEAIDCLKKAVTLDKGNLTYQYEYAMNTLNENNYEKAISMLQLLKKQYPRELDFRLGLAKAYTQAGKYDEAIREYRVASAFDPSDNDTIAAINELASFSNIAKYNKDLQYKRNVMAHPVASPDGQRLVAFNAPENQLSPEEKAEIKAQKAMQSSSQSKTFAVGVPAASKQQYPVTEQPAVSKADVNEMQEQQIQGKSKKAKKAKPAPGSKRVIVSYVNGRKVVKIVNINTESDTTQSLEEASLTFTNQLEESNTGYSQDTEGYKPASYSSPNAFEKPQLQEEKSYSGNSPAQKPQKQTSTQKSSSISNEQTEQINQSLQEDYPRKSKYQVDEQSYISNNDPALETNANGDPNVSALSSYGGTGRRQLLVSYKNGKRVVQMVSADGTVMSQAKSAEKTKKISSKKSNKKENERPAVQTQTTSANNTDLYIKANELMAQNQYAEVINVLQQVKPETLRSLTSIASCYNALGQTDTAIEYYKKADKLSPDNTQILYSIGYLYYTKNDIASAKKYVDLSLKADPANANAVELNKFMSQQDSNVVMNQAVSYMNQNNYSEAKKTLEKLLKDNPSDFQAYYYLGHIGYATQKYEEAAKNFSLAIKYNPEYALSYYSIGLAFDKLKEFSKSRSAYEQFLLMENDDNKYTQYAKTRVSTIKSKQ